MAATNHRRDQQLLVDLATKLMIEADAVITAHDTGKLSPDPGDSCRIEALRKALANLSTRLPIPV